MNTRSEGQRPPPEDDDRPITPSDLFGLPPAQRRVMRILLRSNGMSLEDLSRALEGYPPEERLAPAALAAAVGELEQGRWLMRVEGTHPPVYRAARLGWTGPSKADEHSAERHRGGANRLNDFWESVKEDHDKRPPAPGSARRSGGGQVNSLFSELARPNTSLSDVGADRHEGPKRPASGERISSLFDELSKPTRQPAPEAEAPDEDDQR